MNITELSIRRPVTTIMLFVSMVVIGLIASFRLPLEAEPEATIPFFFVSLPYAGSTSEEVERNLVRPVEEALATMPGIESMNSRANAEGGSIQVRFSDWNKDIAIAASEARERIDAIRDELPDDFRRYFVYRWSTSDREAVSRSLSSATSTSCLATPSTSTRATPGNRSSRCLMLRSIRSARVVRSTSLVRRRLSASRSEVLQRWTK